MEFNPSEIEIRWRKVWQETGLYTVSNDSPLPKYYVLDMFPYPSGSGLHVGHPLGYIASDIFSRFKRLNGYNVLHPMGYDAFGLPAEQYAIQTGVHPSVSTDANINHFRFQLDNLGFSYDWSREIRTSDPTYYKWTQWIFLKLFDHYYDLDVDRALPINNLIQKFEANGSAGAHADTTNILRFSADEWKTMSKASQEEILMNYRLMYRKTGMVNWCEALGTVLANDEVKDCVSERGGFPVIKKPMMQWSMRTTAYADRLLKGLDIVNWPDSLKLMQRNWIGRSEGAMIKFKLESKKESIEIFTTRPDTIFGVTFLALAPEHPLAMELATADRTEAVREYILQADPNKDQSAEKIMTGVFSGSNVIHPFTMRPIPVWIADYVLMEYGTGAIMGVPGSDERDNRFAVNFDLPINQIVDQTGIENVNLEDKRGRMVNSDFLDGLTVEEAIKKMLEELENKKFGARKVNYKLRDANYSRQRYWGEPFPIVYDTQGLPHSLSEDKLPLKLPNITDFKPSGDGSSPLKKATEWLLTDTGVIRETDTMPGFAGSSWYYLRYMDPQNNQALVSNDAINYWQNVDLYIGGAEHAVGHLLYSRMWHKFLFDLGVTVTEEPFERLINQGMIQGVSEKTFMIKEPTSQLFFRENVNNWVEINLDDSAQVFISAELLDQYPLQIQNTNDILWAEMPVNIDFIRDYGASSGGYLDEVSIRSFIDWRPDFKQSIFVTSHGYFIEGNYRQIIKSDDSPKFYTRSEVEKMSKSKYNVISPDDVSDKYGADVFRMYEMFLGPIEQSKPWNISGIEGVSKFAKRFWSLFFDSEGAFIGNEFEPQKEDLKIIHKTIRKVTDDIEKFSFNTSISALMMAVNELKKSSHLSIQLLEPLITIIAPFAPFMSEELWSLAGHTGSVHTSVWPLWLPDYVHEDIISYPVCINGKKRDLIEMDVHADEETIKSTALASLEIIKWLDGKLPKKIILVTGKMVNIVV